MLQKCTALFLLLAFTASSFSKAVIVVGFYANQDYIAKNLCVNRDKPQMHCNGHCQLCKRLAREDGQDKSNPDSRPDHSSEVLFCQEFPVTSPAPGGITATRAYPLSSSGSPVDRSSAFFHPPA